MHIVSLLVQLPLFGVNGDNLRKQEISYASELFSSCQS